MRLRRALLLFILEVDMLENTFKTGLVKELKSRFPGCIVLHADPNEIQGIPDLVVLYGRKRPLHWKKLRLIRE